MDLVFVAYIVKVFQLLIVKSQNWCENGSPFNIQCFVAYTIKGLLLLGQFYCSFKTFLVQKCTCCIQPKNLTVCSSPCISWRLHPGLQTNFRAVQEMYICWFVMCRLSREKCRRILHWAVWQHDEPTDLFFRLNTLCKNLSWSNLWSLNVLLPLICFNTFNFQLLQCKKVCTLQ